jgi:hypothetical protein
LCTTFINPGGVYEASQLSPAVLAAIYQLEQAAYRMLETAIKYGKVYIITNAAEGWV